MVTDSDELGVEEDCDLDCKQQLAGFAGDGIVSLDESRSERELEADGKGVIERVAWVGVG
jgi:hypothetical protein